MTAPMQRIAAFRPIAFDAPTSSGRCVRFTARVEPELAFDACDAATGEALGEIHVWDAHPVRAERRRMLASHEWSLESRVAAEVIALNDAGEFYLAVNPRVGSLGDVFDCLLAITIIAGDEET